MIIKIIEAKLKKKFNPCKILLYNENEKHRKNSKKIHIKIIIISNYFLEKPIINRHNEVHSTIFQEIKNYINSLDIYTYTYNEWKKKQNILTIKKTCLKNNFK
ncbi:BolA/IbaG family iron-sulfur metabolism protein [Buchnera aphidicola (Neophyllaphis podocarpi)]|uniref:BolA/IbaG family iron-sulfur metabolism protein n=1 Tax=Buchnera aphidicola TaxID=9 RepID=UPI0031B85BE3